MTLVIKQKKKTTPLISKTKLKQAPSQEVIIAIDRLAELRKKIKPHKAKLDKLVQEETRMKKTILQYADDSYCKKDSGTIITDNYELKFNAKGIKSTVFDKTALQEELDSIKPGLYFDLSSIGITDIKKYLGIEQRKNCVLEDNINARTLKVSKLEK